MKNIIYLFSILILFSCSSTNNTEENKQDSLTVVKQSSELQDNSINNSFNEIIQKFPKAELAYNFSSATQGEWELEEYVTSQFVQLSHDEAKILCADFQNLKIESFEIEGIENFLNPSEDLPPSEMYQIAKLNISEEFISVVFNVQRESENMEWMSNTFLATFDKLGNLISAIELGQFYNYVGTMGMATTIHTQANVSKDKSITVDYASIYQEGTTPEDRTIDTVKTTKKYNISNNGRINIK